MNKTLTYSGFAIASLAMILVFVTAKTYTQLAIAVIVYPLLAYFALRILPRRNQNAPAITIQIPARREAKVEEVKLGKVEVSDIDKRTFLKLIGAAGISFFVFSVLGRRVDSLLFGKDLGPGISPAETPVGDQASQTAAPTDDYKITEIEDDVVSYYGFTNQDGAWRIMMMNTETNSFRYAKGGSDFGRAWKNRENLKYDYFHKLF